MVPWNNRYFYYSMNIRERKRKTRGHKTIHLCTRIKAFSRHLIYVMKMLLIKILSIGRSIFKYDRDRSFISNSRAHVRVDIRPSRESLAMREKGSVVCVWKHGWRLDGRNMEMHERRRVCVKIASCIFSSLLLVKSARCLKWDFHQCVALKRC